jgi:hypothetical protein
MFLSHWRGGVESKVTLHGLLGLDAWILSSGLDLGVEMRESRKAFLEVVAGEAEQSSSPSVGDRLYCLTCSFKNLRKPSFFSKKLTPPPCQGSSPCGGTSGVNCHFSGLQSRKAVGLKLRSLAFHILQSRDPNQWCQKKKELVLGKCDMLVMDQLLNVTCMDTRYDGIPTLAIHQSFANGGTTHCIEKTTGVGEWRQPWAEQDSSWFAQATLHHWEMS